MTVRFKTNLVSGILSVCFSIFLLLIIPRQISLANNNAYINARIVPQIIALLIGAGGIVLIIQSLSGRDSWRQINLRLEARSLLYMAVILLYAFLLPVTGYIITTLVLGVVTLYLSGVRKVKYYLINVILILFLFSVFTFAFNIQLP
ncbi:MAG: hypothetical protein CSA76_03110 [Spirochaetales bacterium]|nr:MAG: hypothetical protein CSA76_03110 [Spirochaetales bacterium]